MPRMPTGSAAVGGGTKPGGGPGPTAALASTKGSVGCPDVVPAVSLLSSSRSTTAAARPAATSTMRTTTTTSPRLRPRRGDRTVDEGGGAVTTGTGTVYCGWGWGGGWGGGASGGGGGGSD